VAFFEGPEPVSPIRAAHKPVTLAELNAYYPDVPAESNAAVVYKRAFDVLKTNEAFNALEKLEDQLRAPSRCQSSFAIEWKGMRGKCEDVRGTAGGCSV